MWRKILVAGVGTVAGTLIFGASIGAAQPYPMPGSQPSAPETADMAPGADVPNSDPSLLAGPLCNPIWYGCQSEATPWDHPNSGRDNIDFPIFMGR